jgi:hypothetical protein
MQRAQAGRASARIAAAMGDWTAAHSHLSTVVDLLPTLTDHALSHPDRQHHLRQVQGLATDAARAALADLRRDQQWTARTTTAWQHLEQARTVLLTQALHTRTPTDQLRRRRPDLADQLDRLRDTLTAPA